MLIEIFTNGKVMIDGQATAKSYKAEEVLYDYLMNPDGFKASNKGAKKQKAS